jgi:phage protein U
MAQPMMQLGPYQFGLDTAAYQELNRSTEWTWPAQDIFGSEQVLQFVGYGQDSISLPGIVFPEFWGGTSQLDQLRSLGDKGQPQKLVDGRGNILGDYVITGVQEGQTMFAQQGVSRRQSFTVNLVRYKANKTAALAVAPSISKTASSITNTALNVTQSAVSQSSGFLSSLRQSASDVQGLVGSVLTPVSNVLHVIGGSISTANTIKSAAVDAVAAVKLVGTIKNLSQAEGALNGLRRATQGGAHVVGTAQGVFDDAISAMTAAGDSSDSIKVIKSARAKANKYASSAASIRGSLDAIFKEFG